MIKYVKPDAMISHLACLCVPGMGNNPVVKVHYRLGSRNCKLKARVSIVRWNLEEAGGKPLVRRTGIAYKAFAGRTSLLNKAKSNTARIPWCKCGGYMRGRLSLLPGEVSPGGKGQATPDTWRTCAVTYS